MSEPTVPQSLTLSLAQIFEAGKAGVLAAIPGINPIDAAKELMSEAVADKIKMEAAEKARVILASAHKAVITSIVWQNSLLLLSLLPVYLLHSAIPFYMAYVIVSFFTARSLYVHRVFVCRLIRTMSLTKTISAEVREAIDKELTQRQFHERKIVEWLGPSLDDLSTEVAKKLRPDVVGSFVNMAITVVLAFIAFRVFIIPILEQRALVN